MRIFTNIIVVTLIMLTAFGCEKDDNISNNSAKGKITLSAVIDNGGTKTSLGALENSEYPILWSEDDAIAVINNGKLFRFVLDERDAGKTKGTFVLDVYDSCGYTEEDFDTDGSIDAFYPYEAVTYNDRKISYNIPAIQTYQGNIINGKTTSTFGQGAFPMAAFVYSADLTLKFENLFGVLKLQIVGTEDEKLQCVEIFSDKAVNGAASLSFSPLGNKITPIKYPNVEQRRVALKKGNQDITLSTSKSAPTEILIALPAEEHKLSVVIHTDKGIYYKAVTSSKTITVGEILKMDLLNLPEFDNKMAYVENGICYGEGVLIGDEIWAPVNCGYEPANENYKGYPYGKLYQWGRKYGQGYYDANNESLCDATHPYIISEQGSLSIANDPSSADYFYKFWDPTTFTKDILWGGSGTNFNVIKTQYDPCPEGWRVPTSPEINNNLKFDPEIIEKEGVKGVYAHHIYTDTPKIFLPLSGMSKYGECRYRNDYGYYWTTSLEYHRPIGEALIDGIDTHNEEYSAGYSVRCIREYDSNEQ